MEVAGLLVADVGVVDKMACGCDFKDANFGKVLFCKRCGMDLGLDPFKFHNKDKTELYCCEGCNK